MEKLLLSFAAVLSTTFTAAQAAEIGHYNGGIMDIRGYFLPEQPGIYGLDYNYYYTTDRLNNGNSYTMGRTTNKKRPSGEGGFV